MVSVNTLCKNILNVKNAVIEDCNFFSDTDGVKHIRIRARPNGTKTTARSAISPALYMTDILPSPVHGGDLMQAASLWMWNIRHTVLSALNTGYMLPMSHGLIPAAASRKILT